MVSFLIETSDFERRQVVTIGVGYYSAGVHQKGHAKLANLHVKLPGNMRSVNKKSLSNNADIDH